MVDVVLLCREHGLIGVELAVSAQSTGRASPALLTGLQPRLTAHERPTPDLADYDQLLGGTR
jgi:hypothetical protein